MRARTLIVILAGIVLGLISVAGTSRAPFDKRNRPTSPPPPIHEGSGDDSSDDSSGKSSDDSSGDSSDSSGSSGGSGDSSSAGANVVEFAEQEIFFEFNSTDLDLGLHIFFDATGWKEVEVTGPDGTIFEVDNGGGLNQIGSTEVFTESAEPPLDPDNLAAEMAEFRARFPEGEYEFEGETIEGDLLWGTASLSHALPASPMLLFPDPEADENVADPDDTVIEWMDMSGPGDPEIERYEVVVEFEDEETEQVYTAVFQVPADPDSAFHSISVPSDWFEALEELDGDFKAEVVAIEGTRNATISEAEFEVD